jgi:hypothetical protein
MNCERGIDDLAGKTIVLRRWARHLGALALNWNGSVITRRQPDNPEISHKLRQFRALLLILKRRDAKSAAVYLPPGATLDQHDGIGSPAGRVEALIA